MVLRDIQLLVCWRSPYVKAWLCRGNKDLLFGPVHQTLHNWASNSMSGFFHHHFPHEQLWITTCSLNPPDAFTTSQPSHIPFALLGLPIYLTWKTPQHSSESSSNICYGNPSIAHVLMSSFVWSSSHATWFFEWFFFFTEPWIPWGLCLCFVYPYISREYHRAIPIVGIQ